MPRVSNPVLSGFHPDPSICRVGEDFYIATSTFEWFPGVMIHHSKNLVDWKPVTTPLTRKSQLDMAGNVSSGGIWAPCLSYADGQFWLIYTDVKRWTGSKPNYNDGFKDTHNYLVTAPSIEGPWSEPIYMNSSGFDPSLFHDDDGRKWFLNMIWDYRPAKNSFAGIVLQEYSPTERRLVGPIKNIFAGSSLKITEAPHLYRRGSWYYLMTAEGGTAYTHAVTLARSASIDGPYELHPDHPLVTSCTDAPAFSAAEAAGDFEKAATYLRPGLQKAGHGSMVPWEGDEWVLAHLCGRPVGPEGDARYCPLGRETALQRLVWKDDGWPYPVQQGPQTEVEFRDRPGVPAAAAAPETEWREDFDGETWDIRLQTLRLPADDSYDLKSRPGWLRLKGAESPTSVFRQTLLARRVQAFDWEAETLLDFDPEDFQQFAGLSVRYDERTQILLRISNHEGQRCLGIIAYDRGALDLPLGEEEIVLPDGPVRLGVTMKDEVIRFRWAPATGEWSTIGPEYEGWKLSDDYAEPMGFTGMFVGVACFDVSGRRKHADFDYLIYREE